MSNMVKVGDLVHWRGNFGSDVARTAKVTALTKTTYPKEKFGNSVKSATWDSVRKDLVLFNLHVEGGMPENVWAYGNQIDGLAVESGITYDEWKERYEGAIKESMKYAPNMAGSVIWNSRLADLMDAYPEHEARWDAEQMEVSA
jgi:hypothetical protein